MITLQDLKDFINNSENLYLNVLVDIDGVKKWDNSKMNGFQKIRKIGDTSDNNTLGIYNLWISGNGLDSITKYENKEYIGFMIANNQGTYILAKPIDK